jgi:4a-hydroxytetrahydrobiopterin dehydratase
LTESEIEAAVTTVSWQREGDELVRTFTLSDFAEALAFVNRVGALAESMDHHPDISIHWNRVELRVSTHSAGGLTDADFELARAVDALS